MPAAGLPDDADAVAVEAKFPGMRLQPSHRVIDIGKRRRVAVAGLAEIQRRGGNSGARQHLVTVLAAVQIAIRPGAAMQVEHGWKGSVANRAKQPQGHRPAAVMEVFDVFRRVVQHFGRHL